MMLVFAYVILQVALATGDLAFETCGCEDHPQRRVCTAEFVVKGKILSKSITEEEHFIYGVRNVTHYEVQVTTVFKGTDILSVGTQMIHSTMQRSVPCGFPYLQIGEKYLLTGSVDRDDGSLRSEICPWNEKWRDLSEFQKQGLLNGIYIENCDCEISPIEFQRVPERSSFRNLMNELPMKSYKRGRQVSSAGNTCTFDYGTPNGEAIMNKKTCIASCGGKRGCSWVHNDRYANCRNANRLF